MPYREKAFSILGPLAGRSPAGQGAVPPAFLGPHPIRLKRHVYRHEMRPHVRVHSFDECP